MTGSLRRQTDCLTRLTLDLFVHVASEMSDVGTRMLIGCNNNNNNDKKIEK